jgi:uncharacterized protein DUF4265
MVRIRFLDSSDSNTETLWATPVGSNHFRLDNSPFFAYGVSWQDIVEARVGSDNVIEYVRCLEKSGNRTLRVIFQQYRSVDPDAEKVLSGLRYLGCSYEGMQPRLISINVPPRVILSDVAHFLKQQPGLQWEYADPTYEQIMHPVH